MVEFVLKIEDRPVVLQLKKANGRDLRESFLAFSKQDENLRNRLRTYYPTFRYFNETHKMDVEVNPSDSIKKGTLIKVCFSPIVITVSEVNE